VNRKPLTKSASVRAIRAQALVYGRHMLFLYASKVNKYAIQESFFASTGGNEELLYITRESVSSTKSRLNKLGLNPTVIHPEDLDAMEISAPISSKYRIIIDGVCEREYLDKLMTNHPGITALCMYDYAKLKPEQIQELVSIHDTLILNMPDFTVLSARSFDELDVTDATIKRFIKENLDFIILAMIVNTPMCGTDILDAIQRQFNVLLSPGTIYPLLYRLKESGLLACEVKMKKKVYKAARGRKVNILKMLDEHLLANEVLNGFLKSAV